MKTSALLAVFGLLVIGCSKNEIASFYEADNSSSNKQMVPERASAAYAPSGYSLVFEDQFDGPAINPDNWVAGTLRDPVSGHLVPGAKGDHLLNSGYSGYVTPEDSYIENGALVLRNQKRNYVGTSPSGSYQYTSSWVMSMHRVFLNKGYIEIKAQFPSGDKVWPALWLIAEDLTWGPEWDMWEYFGYRADAGGYDVMGMHLCYGAYPNEKWSSAWIQKFDQTFDCEAWHVYGFEWTATYAKWYVDGQLMRTLNASGINPWPNENMYIVLNNGQKTDSPDNTTTWPNYLKIDYIQVYSNTGGGGQTGLTNGGFESGAASPWAPYGTTAISSNNQMTGNYCGYIGADNSGYEYLVGSLSPNTTYTFSGYVKSSNSTNVNICVKEFGGTQVTQSTNSTGYTKLSTTFTTGATNTSAKLCFFKWGNGTGQGWGDDFVLTEGGPSTGNAAPVANAGPDQTVTGNGSAMVMLDGSASTDDVGVTSYVWKEGGVQIATGVKPTVSLATGAHTITLTVVDGGGLTASDNVIVTVNAPLPPSDLIINGSFEDGLAPWTKYGKATIATNNARTGGKSAYISADNAGFDYNISNLTPNTSYTFSGYVKTYKNSKANISATVGGTSVMQSTTSKTYVKLSVTFNTGSNTSAKLSFYRYQNGSGKAWGDDFSLQAN